MDAGFDMPRKIPEEITEVLEYISPHSFITLLDAFNQFKMDIAVTGDSGSGKSTLINALLGLDNDDENAAPTGVVETTMKPAVYEYPNNPHVRLWDLPGMGTPSFLSNRYVETMNFNLYDMFIVVISERFRENNLLLIEEIQKHKKPFYVVRTKVDNDIVSQRKKHNFSETAALSLMRDECLKYLHEKDLHPNVFLVSGHDTESYEMQNLKDAFEKEASELKRVAFPIFVDNLLTAPWRKAMAIKRHALRSGKLSEKDFQELQKIRTHFSNGTEKVKATLEAFDLFQLDVAILGEARSGVTTLVKALIGGASGSTGVEIPAMSPEYPEVRFWDVSGIGMNNSLEEIKLMLDHFDFYVIIVSDWQRGYHIELARAIQDSRKHYHFVQAKIDHHLQAQRDLCCSETEVLDGLRAQCAEELQKANVAESQLFLINSLDRNAFDFFSLKSVLRSDLETVRTSAFAYHVPRVAKQKQGPRTCQIS
ncbi:uncharacterized protein irgq1 isoform X2 [Salminus brasiliensis]|uniref:uncharacterized protein irgq1 isoform X2 n=1 Tax=Salminus brasiliensis TaxID=930266 RepID=UPI003B838F8F